MPSPTYEQNKTHIYNWRNKYPEKYNKQKQKDIKKRAIWNEIQKIFLNILI